MDDYNKLLELALLKEWAWDNESNLGKIAKKQGVKNPRTVAFEVTKKFSVWIMGNLKPTNAYYGSSRISKSEWEKGSAEVGDIIIGTAAGISLLPGGNKSKQVMIRVGSKDPGDIDPFEKNRYYSKFPEGSLQYTEDY